MKLKKFDRNDVLLSLSIDELRGIGNAFNEVLNGFRVEDFGTKMGVEPNQARKLHHTIISKYREIKRMGSASVSLCFSRHELRAIIGALNEVCREIDQIEFATRMGVQLSEVDQIRNELIPIFNRMKQPVNIA